MDPNYDPLKGIPDDEFTVPACIKRAHKLHDILSVVLDASDPDAEAIRDALDVVHERLDAYAAKRA